MDSTRGEDLLGETNQAKEVQAAAGRVHAGSSGRHAQEGGDTGFFRERNNFTNFHSSEEGRRQQATSSAQPTMGESTHPEAKVQDADDEGGQASHLQGRIHGQDRPQRHVLASSSSSSGPAFPGVPLARQELHLQRPSDGPYLQPDDCYQGFQTSGSQAPRDGTSGSYLHRRSSDLRQDPGGVRGGGPRYSDTAGLFGSYSQLGQVRVDTNTSNHLPRFRDRLSQDDDQGSGEQDQEHQERAKEVPQGGYSFSKRGSINPRQDQQPSGRDLSSQDSHKRPSGFQAQDSAGGLLEHDDAEDIKLDRGLQVVDSKSFCSEREVFNTYPNRFSGGFGRLRPPVGGLDPDRPRSSEVRGLLHGGGSQPAHKRQRTVGDQLRDRMLARHHQGSFSSNRLGQYHSSGLREPLWGPPGSSSSNCPKDLGASSAIGRNDQSFLPSGGGEYASGFSIAQPRPAGRVHAPAGSLQQDRPDLGPTLDRPFRLSSKLTSNSFREQDPFARSLCSGRFFVGLEGRERVDSSAVHDGLQSSGKDFSPGGRSNPSGSALASPAVVPTVDSTCGQGAAPTKLTSKRVRKSNRETLESIMGYSIVEDIFKQAQAKGLSEGTAKNLVSSWDPSTVRQYDSFWRGYKTHCEANAVAPFDAKPAEFTNWLSVLLDTRPAAETVKKSLYVVSNILQICSGAQGPGYTQLPQVQQLLKSAGKICTPRQPKYKDIFDISLCFEYLHPLFKEWGAIRPFVQETWFLILLLKTILGWRADDLAGITRKFGLRRFERGYEIRFWDGKRNKSTWSGFTQLFYLSEEWTSLCVCSAIDRVLAGIDAIIAANHLEPELISVLDFDGGKSLDYPILLGVPTKRAESIHPLKSETIGKKAMDLLNAIKDGQKTLGQKFTAHSFRHAVTSHLRDAKVSMDMIAAHLQTKADSLRENYSTPVLRAFDLPLACMDASERLQAKVLLPYVHFISSTKEADDATLKPGTCKCAGLFRTAAVPFKASVEVLTT